MIDSLQFESHKALFSVLLVDCGTLITTVLLLEIREYFTINKYYSFALMRIS